MKLLLPIVLVITLAFSSLLQANDSLRVYFIGNSLTMSTTLDRVHQLVEQHGFDLEFGSQLSGGKSLIRHMNYKEEPNQKWKSWETNVKDGDDWLPDENMYVDAPGEIHRFGLYDQALVEHEWDQVIFQLYGGSLHDDLKAISTFIDLAEAKESPKSYTIYSTWPRRSKEKAADGTIHVKNIDYQAVWQEAYTATADQTDKQAGWNYSTRSYVDQLYAALKKKYPDITLRLVPAGEVLYVLDQKIKAGELPGLKELAERDPAMVPGVDDDTTYDDGINVFYADAVHMNPMPHQMNSIGIFVSGTCVATGITQKSPIGLSAEPYGLEGEENAALVKALQETIWEVFTADPRTGIK